MTKRIIDITWLYPNEMNIYGDFGNVLALKKRLEWYGFAVNIINHEPGKTFSKETDIVIGGGGQDSGQGKVQADLLKNADKLRGLADGNTPMLVICGLYQLFGRNFKTVDDELIEGVGIFKMKTIAEKTRLIGNVNLDTDFGIATGYENHSGKTYLDKNQQPFGKVIKGDGNNGEDKTEGARYRNTIGSYLHGSLLPKNPELADFLIKQAVIKKFGGFKPKAKIDDSFATQAREIAMKRPR